MHATAGTRRRRVLTHPTEAVAGPGLTVLDDADGHATDQSGRLLTVALADCAPVFVVDPVARAVALVHAGWRGAAAGISGRRGGGVGAIRKHAEGSVGARGTADLRVVLRSGSRGPRSTGPAPTAWQPTGGSGRGTGHGQALALGVPENPKSPCHNGARSVTAAPSTHTVVGRSVARSLCWGFASPDRVA